MNDLVTSGGPSTALNQWDPMSGAPLPAHLADAAAALGGNIPDRQTVPSISYEGKTWTIVKDGNKTKLQAKNQDGDMVPVPIMRFVVLNFNADRGRAYYPGVYNPAASAAPTCWSADGKAPDASVKEKQNPLCTGCPQSIKGSKVQDGKEMVACSSHRMIAVVPAFDLAYDPLRLKIAVTSDYDKEIVEHGWFAFRQYLDFLKSRGIAHTGLVVTKAKFDPNAAYPKLLFSIDRPLSPEEVVQVLQAAKNPKVAELLAEKWTAAGVNGTPTDDSDIAPNPADVAAAEAAETARMAAAQAQQKPASEMVIDQVVTTPAQPTVPAPGKPKPTDATHIAHAGTEHEVWWNGEAWVKPWPLAAAPDPSPPPAPPAPIVAEVKVTVDPLALARADGWIVHPDAPGYHYKGQEVVADGDLATKYPSASAATPAVSVPAATPANGSPTSAAGQTATSGASPSDAAGVVPADVQSLLDKWT
jgi:hypothetical protein